MRILEEKTKHKNLDTRSFSERTPWVELLEIKDEDIFTISCKRIMKIVEVKKIVQLAIKHANNCEKPKTDIMLFGEASSTNSNASRHFHGFIVRTITQKEKEFIKQHFEEINKKANFGSGKLLFKWGLQTKDDYGIPNFYLERHSDYWFVPVFK